MGGEEGKHNGWGRGDRERDRWVDRREIDTDE